MSIDGDRAYDDRDYTQFFANLFTNGVSLTTADGLKVKENPNGRNACASCRWRCYVRWTKLF